MIPRGATIIENEKGTAAGIDAAYKSGDQKTICRIFVMPGVPKEMKGCFAARRAPAHVQRDGGGAAILSRTLHTFGVGERHGRRAPRAADDAAEQSVGRHHGCQRHRLAARQRALRLPRAGGQRIGENRCGGATRRWATMIFGADEQTLQGQVGTTLISKGSGSPSPRVARADGWPRC
jgi:nicotinamide-nucleotide amidase